jgi:hypothetical protein
MTSVAGWRFALAAVPALLGVAIAVALRGDATACRVAVLLTGGYGVGILLMWMRRATARPVARAAPYHGEVVEPLSQLATIERSVALSRSSAVEFQLRVQPYLRRAASERLRIRHRIDLDHDPDAARRLLGDATWRLLTTHHSPDDRTARPPGIDTIIAAVDRVEEV